MPERVRVTDSTPSMAARSSAIAGVNGCATVVETT
jgi:hypothetical protein